MFTKTTTPTPEMFEASRTRTQEHIARVAANLLLIAKTSIYAEELRLRALEHDSSKFGSDELIPYVWLNEYHCCRRSGVAFEYPEGMEEQVKLAIRHHVTSNRHHSEYHSDPNDMTPVDLIEMVCDWTAMSQEFGQDGGSARGRAELMIGHRFQFNEEQARFIYDVISELDKHGECPVAGG